MFFYCSKPQEKISFDLKVQSLIGEVKIKSPSGVRNASSGEIVAEGDLITTGNKSVIDLVYGERGLIRIQENSVVYAEVLKEQASGETQLNLNSGKTFISVSRLLKDSKFRVKTPTTVIAIRGTAFRISTTTKGSSVDVLSGKVMVNPVKDGTVIESVETIVAENQTAELTEKEIAGVIEKKTEIRVVELNSEKREEIRNETKDVTPEVLNLIHADSVKEIEKLIKPDDSSDSKNKENELNGQSKQSPDEKQIREQQAKNKNDAAVKLAKEQEEKAKQDAADKIAKEQEEKTKQEELLKKAEEKKKKERASSVPTM